ncbi:MAG: TIM barrel protein [Spirochaetales bacterium]|nr:TIM barrel protein [Spirochaetales bacterium]
MSVTRSLVLNALVPDTVHDMDVFVECLKRLQGTKVKTIEYYTPFENVKERGRILREMGFERNVYLIAGRQKAEGLSLCSVDESERLKAMDLTKRALDAALEAGFSAFLITSGRNVPEGDRKRAMDALRKSLDGLFRIAGDGYDIDLEPGDTCIDACQLIGPIAEAAAFAQEVRRDHEGFTLTLDTSHIAQLGESFDKAFEVGKGVSNHVHLASCILKEGHPLFGDKHPLFGNPDGVYSSDDMKKIMDDVILDYEKRGMDLTIGVEVIDRTGKRFGSLDEVLAESHWFF